MEKNASSTVTSKVQQGLTLGFYVDRVEIGKNKEDVKLGKILLGESIYIVRIGDVDGLGPEGLAEHSEASGRIVVEEVFAPKEKNFDAAGLKIYSGRVLCSP